MSKARARQVEVKFRPGGAVVVHNNAKWNPKKVGMGPSAPAVLKYKYQHNREVVGGEETRDPQRPTLDRNAL